MGNLDLGVVSFAPLRGLMGGTTLGILDPVAILKGALAGILLGVLEGVLKGVLV